MYINGIFIETNEKVSVKNPFFGEVVYEVAFGDESHVEEGIHAATAAFKTWSKTTALERSNYLSAIATEMTARKEHLATVITKEMGKQ